MNQRKRAVSLRITTFARSLSMPNILAIPHILERNCVQNFISKIVHQNQSIIFSKPNLSQWVVGMFNNMDLEKSF